MAQEILTPEFVYRVVDFCARHEIEGFLWWHPVSPDGFWSESGTLRCSVNCSDWFYCATSDGEDLTEATFDDFVKAVLEVESINKALSCAGPGLYACRKRGMRPQKACYEDMDERLRPLFDSCGPERNGVLVNPGVK